MGAADDPRGTKGRLPFDKLPPDPHGLRERLAALCHDQWSGWITYQFSKCASGFDIANLVIPGWAVERWTRQSSTTYDDLSEEEKESDRKEADRFLAILRPEIEASAAAEKEACARLALVLFPNEQLVARQIAAAIRTSTVPIASAMANVTSEQLGSPEHPELRRAREQHEAYIANLPSPRSSVPPFRALLPCPNCGTPHVDRGEWATMLHHTHLCEKCHRQWRVEPYAFGLDPGIPRETVERAWKKLKEALSGIDGVTEEILSALAGADV